MKTRFLNKNGYYSERKRAAELFDTQTEYTITGGEIHNSSSTYTFAEVPGHWNTVMFDVDWEQVSDIMDHLYAK